MENRSDRVKKDSVKDPYGRHIGHAGQLWSNNWADHREYKQELEKRKTVAVGRKDYQCSINMCCGLGHRFRSNCTAHGSLYSCHHHHQGFKPRFQYWAVGKLLITSMNSAPTTYTVCSRRSCLPIILARKRVQIESWPYLSYFIMSQSSWQ